MTNDEKKSLPIYTFEEMREKRQASSARGFTFGCLVCSAAYQIARGLGWTS